MCHGDLELLCPFVWFDHWRLGGTGTVSQHTATVSQWEGQMLHTKDEPWRSVGSAWPEMA